MPPKRVGSELLGSHECLPFKTLQDTTRRYYHHISIIFIMTLATLPLIFDTMDYDWTTMIIGYLCLPLLLHECYVGFSTLFNSFYHRLDPAPPWNITHIPTLYHPHHFRKHGRYKSRPRYPAVRTKHLWMVLQLILFERSLSFTINPKLHEKLRHIPWGSPPADPWMLSYFHLDDNFLHDRDPTSKIMNVFKSSAST